MEIIDFYYFAVVYCNPWMFSESDISGDVAVKNKTNTGSHFVSTPTYTEKKIRWKHLVIESRKHCDKPIKSIEKCKQHDERYW